MVLKNFTIKKIYPLLQKENSQGIWQTKDLILKDDSHEYGDVILCRLHGEKAANFNLLQGDLVEAHVDFRTREFTSDDGVERHMMEARCWKIDQVTV